MQQWIADKTDLSVCGHANTARFLSAAEWYPVCHLQSLHDAAVWGRGGGGRGLSRPQMTRIKKRADIQMRRRHMIERGRLSGDRSDVTDVLRNDRMARARSASTPGSGSFPDRWDLSSHRDRQLGIFTI